MTNDITVDDVRHQTDDNQSTDNSLLESILFLMTPEQREYFLKSSSSSGIFYTNRSTEFNHPLSVMLTRTAYNQLAELLKDENQNPVDFQLQNQLDAHSGLEILKTDLEAGIRLSGPPVDWYDNNNGDEDIPIHVQSRLFSMQCRLKVEAEGKAFLTATYMKSASVKNFKKNENQDFRCDEIPEFEEPIDIDIVDGDTSAKNSAASVESKSKVFYPHIKTTWHIYPPSSSVTTYFDSAAIEKIIWEITSSHLFSKIYYWTREHLKELAYVVNLSQMAMQFRYELINEIEIPEGRCCKLKVVGPPEEVIEIKRAYVYAEENGAGDSTESRYDNIFQMKKHRRRKSCVLERKGYERGFHLFDIVKGEEIPPEGFLVDAGSESQIKKRIDAMYCLEKPKSAVHLIKLAALLGEIKPSEFEPFSWKSKKIELFDKQLIKRQREAVLKALNTPDICLIQGPPGTGKTRVISEIVQQASKRGWKTLLVAPTHVAVDNVLERIGYKDNISPIRCVNKDKLEDLPEYIQQFSFDQRKNSLILHSQDKVKEDIDRLNKEQNKLEEVSEELQSLQSLFENTAELGKKERSLKKQLSTVEQNVQKEFAEELQNNERTKREKDKFLCDSKTQLATTEKALQNLEARTEEFKTGLYTSKDKTRFKLAQSDVDKTQGKVLDDIKGQFNEVNKLIQSKGRKIEQTKAELTNTKEILYQLDKGGLPEVVKKSIKRVVDSVTAEQDRSIADRMQNLEKAQDRLFKKKKTNDSLRRLLEKTKEKCNKLAQKKGKSWSSKAFSLMWWQSKLIDFETRQSEYAYQLQNALALIPELELEIEKAELSLGKSKIAKKEAIERTNESEYIKQHNLYRSRHDLLGRDLNFLEIELQKEDSKLAMLGEKVEVAQNNFEQASNLALESVKKRIFQELASEIEKARKDVLCCKEEVESASKLVHESQIDINKLHDKIDQIIKQKEKQLGSSIDTVKKQIASNNDRFEYLKKQVALLMEEKPFEQPSDIQDALENISQKIERNKQLIVFSENWLDCLDRNADKLSKRLAKYINLVCATTIGIASDEYFGDGQPLEQKQFDLLVVDEAGKATEPEFLVAATRAKKWVIVGDHKQLPPYYDRKLNKIFAEVNELRNQNDLSQLDPSVLQISYFENLWNQLFASDTEPEKANARFVTLDVQRRMHPDLALFISDMFYQGEYKSPEGPKFIKEKTIDLSRFKYPVTFIEVSPPKGGQPFEINLRYKSDQESLNLTCKTGYANLTEAQKVIEVLCSLFSEESIFHEQKKLDRKKASVATIGIIAFYAGQVELIRKLIKENDFLEAQEQSSNGQFLCKRKIKVVVNTVDSFQGKECSVIILSFTRSNPHRNIGFVDDANRLNVAMSRAQKKLILLGDTNTFINRASVDDARVKGDDTNSIRAERLFFEKLVRYIEGHGEIKKAFHVWRT